MFNATLKIERRCLIFDLSPKSFFTGGGSLTKLYGTHGPGVYLLYNADAVNINTSSDLLVEWPSPSLSHKAAGLKSDVVNISLWPGYRDSINKVNTLRASPQSLSWLAIISTSSVQVIALRGSTPKREVSCRVWSCLKYKVSMKCNAIQCSTIQRHAI